MRPALIDGNTVCLVCAPLPLHAPNGHAAHPTATVPDTQAVNCWASLLTLCTPSLSLPLPAQVWQDSGDKGGVVVGSAQVGCCVWGCG